MCLCFSFDCELFCLIFSKWIELELMHWQNVFTAGAYFDAHLLPIEKIEWISIRLCVCVCFESNASRRSNFVIRFWFGEKKKRSWFFLAAVLMTLSLFSVEQLSLLLLLLMTAMVLFLLQLNNFFSTSTNYSKQAQPLPEAKPADVCVWGGGGEREQARERARAREKGEREKASAREINATNMAYSIL